MNTPPPAGKTFPELYDVARVEPTPEHLEQYRKAKEELKEFGVPFKY
ncbi:MAG: monomethylamine:corrinoid methyltransferase [Chloroflexi bacterium]|nr:monomethylamine:corrinoid methyltransferase [Chloroflexota bacterium]